MPPRTRRHPSGCPASACRSYTWGRGTSGGLWKVPTSDVLANARREQPERAQLCEHSAVPRDNVKRELQNSSSLSKRTSAKRISRDESQQRRMPHMTPVLISYYQIMRWVCSNFCITPTQARPQSGKDRPRLLLSVALRSEVRAAHSFKIRLVDSLLAALPPPAEPILRGMRPWSAIGQNPKPQQPLKSANWHVTSEIF